MQRLLAFRPSSISGLVCVSYGLHSNDKCGKTSNDFRDDDPGKIHHGTGWGEDIGVVKSSGWGVGFLSTLVPLPAYMQRLVILRRQQKHLKLFNHQIRVWMKKLTAT